MSTKHALALDAWRAAHPGLTPWYERASTLGEEIAELLRALTDERESVREEALLVLFDEVVVEDELTAASAPLVPLLLELLGEPDIADKDQLLVAIDELGDVGSALLEEAEAYAALEAEGVEVPDDAPPPPSDEALERAQAVRQGLLAGADTVLALLDDADAATRTCASYALTVCFDADETARARRRDIAETLLARLAAEAEPSVRASLLLTLGLSSYSPAVESIRARLGASDSDLERLAAAMALVPFFGHVVEDDALLTMIDVLADPESLQIEYDELPWCDLGLISDLSGVLASFSDEQSRPVLAPLLERLARCDKASGQSALVRAALHVAFEELSELAAEDITPDDLPPFDAEQRQLLAALADDDRLWQPAIDAGALLDEIGLPFERDALRQL